MSHTPTIVAFGTLDKHPAEVLALKLDFTRQLEAGESLSGAPTADAEAGSDLTVDELSLSGTKAIFRVSGGSVGTWDITVTVTVAGGPFTQTFVGVCRINVTTG